MQNGNGFSAKKQFRFNAVKLIVAPEHATPNHGNRIPQKVAPSAATVPATATSISVRDTAYDLMRSSGNDVGVRQSPINESSIEIA
ncbi:hypothetical protein QTH97_16760 [Variovorax sp. J22R24]|uniref:hypothetical protein n=1 Tax=Variovorax gracilis TaxID=3053502 RepID=UPI002577B215|nr:hypothetical protein [Variovorax sp. J22R24]MDM0106599.1 hypothetical protein [Variovorax sp. J22R24]